LFALCLGVLLWLLFLGAWHAVAWLLGRGRDRDGGAAAAAAAAAAAVRARQA
jgi:hypothetical protein